MKKVVFLVLVLLSTLIFPKSILADCHNELSDGTDDGFAVGPDDTYKYFPAADITSTWMQPAYNYPAMEFGVTTKEAFIPGNEHNFNIFFFLDIDNDLSNNAQSGTRAGADSAFSLLWSIENQEYKTITWTYDPASDNWDYTIDPSILFMPLDLENGFIIHVPYEMIPEDANVPFRSTVAISQDKQSMMDSAPNGNGAMNNCNNDKQATTIMPEKDKDEDISDTTPVTKKSNNILLYILFSLGTIIFFGGIGQVIKKHKNDPALGKDEEITCKCKRCSLYICVGRNSDRAIGSALNLGKAIKRDTEAGEKDKCCVKVMHFKSQSMRSGRYIGYSKKKNLEWKKFSKQKEGIEKNAHSDICMWNKVMIVMHGENKGKVKSVIKKLSSLIPKAPIKRLILYYCGGGATLPEKEFGMLASQLGKRLKNIPKECRPKNVELFIAPTVSFNDTPTYTVLSINKSGLTSFEGKMMSYLSDEKGTVTKVGNKIPAKRLFGCVELGNLESTPEANASTYMSHWRRICKLKLSEIRKYRKYIKKADMKTKKGKLIEPPFCRKEAKAAKIEKILKEHNAGSFSPDELDELVEKRSSDIKKALRVKVKASR